MLASKVIPRIAVLLFVAASIDSTAWAALEQTTPNSPFTIGSPTAAIVTSYSPVLGDDGGFPSTTGSIYNLFGASNPSVEENGDTIFGDNNAQPNTVAFITPVPVTLTGVAVYLDSDDGNLDGPRSVGTFTFYANKTLVIDASPVNESISADYGINVFMFLKPITASNFLATFSDNPNLNFKPDPENDAVGPRVYELDGIVPEPASTSILAITCLGHCIRRKR